MTKDLIHDAVKIALIKDGWTITHDPYAIQYEEVKLAADLGAERTLAAERGEEKIVVEIKSFVSRSEMQDLKIAVGQYMIYKGLLKFMATDRKLYLAVSDLAFEETFSKKAVQALLSEYGIAMFVVNIQLEEVIRWINW